MSAKDFKQHMLNELRELERLIRNDCGRDNGLDTSYEPEELKWFEKLHELQELCDGNNIDASDSKLPLCGVSIAVCKAPSKVLPCSHFYSNRCLHPNHCNYKQTEC